MASQENLNSRQPLGQIISTARKYQPKIGLMFCYTFASTGAYVVSRSAADSLFLSRIGPSYLPFMYFLGICAIGTLSVGWAFLARWLTFKTTMLLTLSSFVSLSLVAFMLLHLFDYSLLLLAAIYLLSELRGSVNTIHHKILVTEFLTVGDDQNYAAGRLGAAATLARIVLGGLIAFEIDQIGTTPLLCLAAGLELLAMIPIALLPHSDPDARPENAIRASAMNGYATLSVTPVAESPTSSGVFRHIAALMALGLVTATLIEFQWKTQVADTFAGNEDRMTAYFGIFYVVVNMLTCIIQMCFTGSILRILGPRHSLMVFSATLLVGMLAIAFARTEIAMFSALTFLKACDVYS